MLFISGNASADTRALYPSRYPANFLLVNATAVPVWRSRYVGTGRGTIPSAAPWLGQGTTHLYWGLALIWNGMLTSRTGRSIPPGCEGASRPSVGKKDCSESELVAKSSSAVM